MQGLPHPELGNTRQDFEETVLFDYIPGSSLLLPPFLPMQVAALMPLYSKTAVNHQWLLIKDCAKGTVMPPETAVMQEPETSAGRRPTMSSLLV